MPSGLLIGDDVSQMSADIGRRIGPAGDDAGGGEGGAWSQQGRGKRSTSTDVNNGSYNITAIVAKTKKSLHRKSLNVVVSGLAEQNSEGGDEALFMGICKDYLKWVPTVISCKRL